MKNLRKIAFSCLLLLALLGLGACEPTKDPEAEIGGVIRAKINGQPWESTQIVWGELPYTLMCP